MAIWGMAACSCSAVAASNCCFIWPAIICCSGDNASQRGSLGPSVSFVR